LLSALETPLRSCRNRGIELPGIPRRKRRSAAPWYALHCPDRARRPSLLRRLASPALLCRPARPPPPASSPGVPYVRVGFKWLALLATLAKPILFFEKASFIQSKNTGQPRGQRREPERTGERPKCAHRRVHKGSERAAAAVSDSAAANSDSDPRHVAEEIPLGAWFTAIWNHRWL